MPPVSGTVAELTVLTTLIAGATSVYVTVALSVAVLVAVPSSSLPLAVTTLVKLPPVALPAGIVWLIV